MAKITLRSGKRRHEFSSGESKIHDENGLLLISATFNQDGISARISFIEKHGGENDSNKTIPEVPINRENPIAEHEYRYKDTIVTARAKINF